MSYPKENRAPKITFITNFCAHYRVKTFETLAKHFDVEFIFFSDGGERYWDPKHGVRLGNFRGIYLKGIRVFGTRIVPALISKLLFGRYDVVIKCITGRFALPITYIIARLRRKPFILWTNLWYHPETLFHRMSLPVTRWIYRHSDAIAVFGKHVQQYLLSLGVEQKKIFITSQAVDNEMFGKKVSALEIADLKKSLGIGNEKVVLYVGRFDPIKGLEYLTRAVSELPEGIDCKLLMVGEGTELNFIRKEVEALSIQKRVVFVNYVRNTELPKYYALARVVVLPSVTLRGVKEVWGLVINEAMCQGCPVVTTGAVGAAAGGLVQDGITGFVVPERSSGSLAAALSQILTDDKLYSRMRASTRREINQWSYDRQVNGFVEAFRFAVSIIHI